MPTPCQLKCSSSAAPLPLHSNSKPPQIARVREIAPSLPLLIPGVGAQGGDAAATLKAGLRKDGELISGPIIVNSSRAILYASQGEDFAHAARNAALQSRAVLSI